LSSNYLIHEPPLVVLPTLAVALGGLNEAIFLQQCHYWMQRSKHARDGRTWFWKRHQDWLEEFPFWSESTIKRVCSSLRKKGLIDTEQMLSTKLDRRNWFSVNYPNLNALIGDLEPKRPSVQIDPIDDAKLISHEVKVTPSPEPDRPIASGQSDPISKGTDNTQTDTTRRTTTSSSADVRVVEEILEELGASPQQIIEHATLRNTEYVARLLDYADEQEALGKIKTSKLRFVLMGIREEWTIPDKTKPPRSRKDEASLQEAEKKRKEKVAWEEYQTRMDTFIDSLSEEEFLIAKKKAIEAVSAGPLGPRLSERYKRADRGHPGLRRKIYEVEHPEDNSPGDQLGT
jgi:hypothetical protein